MSDSIKENLKKWVQLNNWGGSNPNDTDRFYDFIIEVYKNNSYVSQEEFSKTILESLDFTPNENTIEQYYLKYEFGLFLLKHFNH